MKGCIVIWRSRGGNENWNIQSGPLMPKDMADASVTLENYKHKSIEHRALEIDIPNEAIHA